MSHPAAAHIVLLCSRLDLPGGIEKAVITVANQLAAHNNRVTLLLLDETAETFYPVNEGVHLVQYALHFGITRRGNMLTRKIKFLSDIRKLKRILQQLAPTHIIASEYPFAVAAELAGGSKLAKLYSWEHHHFHELGKSRFWERMVQHSYPKMQGIICLNPDEQKLYSPLNKNTLVIPNSIAPNPLRIRRDLRILTVARLTAVKGIDSLLEIAGQVLQANHAWTWTVIGDGELKPMVQSFIQKHNLEKQFELRTPQSHDLQKAYASASLYVMTSVNECFPMTLLEAQAAGLPCIAFDCETGPRHIITKETGILVHPGNTEAMNRAIQQLIDDPSLREKMGTAAIEHSRQFEPESILQQWSNKIIR